MSTHVQCSFDLFRLFLIYLIVLRLSKLYRGIDYCAYELILKEKIILNNGLELKLMDSNLHSKINNKEQFSKETLNFIL